MSLIDNFVFAIAAYAGLLFVAMLVLVEAGIRAGARRLARDPESAHAGVGAVDGAVFALLGLLVAFTFSGAASRFDERRQLVTREANAIGTAWLRIDVLPPSTQPPLRDLFRRYLDSRIVTYRELRDLAKAKRDLERSAALQREIWKQAVAAASQAPTPVSSQLLPALNEMFDIVTTRTMAVQMHPPTTVFVMLAGMAMISAFMAGYGMARAKGRNWFHIVGFAAVIALTFYVILDIEHPRLGLIRADAVDAVLEDLRRSMD
jgi:hypothetical protein